MNKKSPKYISHEEWLKTRREKAKREAARHANIKYEEFKKTNIYKTAKLVTDFLYYLYVLLAALMIVSPLITIFIRGLDPQSPATSVVGVVILVFLGIVFMVTLISHKKDFNY